MTASIAAARFALDIDGVHRTARAQALLDTLSERVVIADGAMGTMLQRHDLQIDTDFHGLEGCNEILNVTRPDVVGAIHDAYFAVGVDAVETNTFGANWSNLSDYGIDDRITELAAAGARIARERAEAAEAVDGRMRWVLGSMGPGTKLPSLGHTTYAHLKETFALQAEGLIDGGADAFLVETSQDLLQTKAAINGCKQAIVARGIRLPIFVEVTVETTGAMLMGSEIGAALTALEPLGVDAIGLNCATGPAEMSEHLRHLSKHSSVTIACMPNAGLPVLTADGAHYPLTPAELATAHEQFVREFGIGLIGGCCGTTPEHLAAVVERVGRLSVATRTPDRETPPGHRDTESAPVSRRENGVSLASAIETEPGVASLYQHVPFRQDASHLAIGERTNANGSKAFREAMLEGRWEDCVEIARGQIRVGAHLLDVCVDYVGRDGVADIREVVSRFASASTLPLVIDSTEPAVIQAGLELIGGRPVVNSVNYEDGDGPASRFGRIMPLVKEHGTAVIALTIDEQGQARTAEDKLRIASRLVDELVGAWGMRVEDIIVDCLTFPIATGQEETRRDGIETIEANRGLVAKYPGINTTLGVSNVSFGLQPRRPLGAQLRVPARGDAGGADQWHHRRREDRAVGLPPRRAAEGRARPRLGPARMGCRRHPHLRPAGNDARPVRRGRHGGPPRPARRRARGAPGRRATRAPDHRRGAQGSRGRPPTWRAAGDADAAPLSPLQIINDHLLEGMKVVGERFGSGQMQLPFVLQSAEVMKTAVALLEPHMEKTDEAGKGTIVLATVRGDVHDIGKNLVDIILTNNGYTVINLGIKQPIADIIAAAEEHDADVIGLSGLLVKSTVVMKENLEELMARGLGTRWPVILGGAALTRAYVEQDLAELFEGEGPLREGRVRGARPHGAARADRARRSTGCRRPAAAEEAHPCGGVASDPHRARGDAGAVGRGIRQSRARPAVLGDAHRPRHRARRLRRVPRRAGDLHGAVGAEARAAARADGRMSSSSRPRAGRACGTGSTAFLAERMLDASVAYGYFPVVSEGDDIVVLHHGDDPTGLLGRAGLLAPDGGRRAARSEPTGCASTSRASAATGT